MVTSGKVLSSAAQLVFFAIFARTFGVSTFGQFSAFYAAVLLLMSLFELGFGNRALRILADRDHERTIGTMVSIRLASNAIVFASVATAAVLLHIKAGDLLIATAVYATGDLFANLAQNILIGLQREVRALLLLAGRRAIVLGFLIGSAHFPDSFRSISEVLYAAGLISGLAGLGALRRFMGRPNHVFGFLWLNRGYAMAGFFANLQQLDVIGASFFGGSTFAGLYGAASRLSGSINLLATSAVQTLTPVLAVQASAAGRVVAMRKVLRIAYVAAVAVCAAAVLSPVFTTWIFGYKFAPAWPLVTAVIVCGAIGFPSQVLTSLVYADGIPRWFIGYSVLASCSVVIAVSVGAAAGSPKIAGVALVAVALGAHVLLRVATGRLAAEIVRHERGGP